MSGVDDASLDGAELDLDGAEQLLPRQEDDQEVAKQRGDSRVGTRPFHERYEGITEQQFTEWRSKFDARIARMGDDSRSLMSREKLNKIHRLLSDWDNLSNKQRRAISGSAHDWKKKYEAGPNGVLYTIKDSLVCVPKEELFDYLVPLHFAGNCCKGLLTFKRVQPLYYHVTKVACFALCDDCPDCLKAAEVKKPRAGGTPIITQGMNQRGQVDLVDMQSLEDPTFRWMLNYQDHAIKDVYLIPLRSKRMIEVAYALVNIFKNIGVPLIIHTDNGKEFASLANGAKHIPISDTETDELIGHIRDMWPDAIMVKGRPRHSESQGSIERSNRLVQMRIGAWMRANNSKAWSIGLPFIQWGINTDYHSGTKARPYELRFGQRPTCGLSSAPLTPQMRDSLRTEQELLDHLPQAQRELLLNEDIFVCDGDIEKKEEENEEEEGNEEEDAAADGALINKIPYASSKALYAAAF